MKHYPIEKWTDFVRGIVDGPEHSEMASHLDAPCRSCGRLVALLGVMSAAPADVEVPETFLQRARAIFPARPAPDSALRRLVAALQFDSMAELAPAGVRSIGTARRLVYAVDGVVVELLIDSEDRRRVILTGRVSRDGTNGPLAGSPVMVRTRRQVITQTEASEFGEFHLDFSRQAGAWLVVVDRVANCEIELRLDLGPRGRTGETSL